MTLKERIKYLYDNSLYRDAIGQIKGDLSLPEDVREKALILYSSCDRSSYEWRRAASKLIQEVFNLPS